MSKIQRLVCEICNQVDCDGVVYVAVNKTNRNYMSQRRVCKNIEDVEKRNGEYYYHWVMAHGIEDYFLLKREQNV